MLVGGEQGRAGSLRSPVVPRAPRVEQVVGGAAAPGDVPVPERRDPVDHGGRGPEPGQGVQRRSETDGRRLPQFGVGQPVTGGVPHSGFCGAARPRVRSASGFTARYAVSAASASSNSAAVTASGTVQPSSPGCASIIRSSR